METWKDICNFEGLYQVSSLGRVKSLPKRYGNQRTIRPEQVLNANLDKGGYLQLVLSKNDKQFLKKVHRLVSEAFIPCSLPFVSSRNPQINHLNGNKLDNRVENLEWCTPLQNKRHASNLGLVSNGTKNGHNLLTETQVREVRRRYVPYKCPLSQLAKEYGVTKRCIYHIVQGTSWAWLQ